MRFARPCVAAPRWGRLLIYVAAGCGALGSAACASGHGAARGTGSAQRDPRAAVMAPGTGTSASLAQLQALDPNVPPQQIAVADLPEATVRQLRDLDDLVAQRRYALTWTGIEEVVAARLLRDEAARRHIDVAQLLRDEVDSRVGAPSDDEMRDLYETNKKLINIKFVDARAQLKQLWRSDRESQLRRALVDRLRQGVGVQLLLSPPELSRRHVLATGPARGRDNAKINIVAFGDYQCPYTAQARRALQRLEELNPVDVRIVYRDALLPQHARSRSAAEAAHCAHEQQKYWAYSNLLFDHSNALQPADLRRYAEQAELDLAAFDACRRSERPERAVAQSLREAQNAQVEATPVIFINGMAILGVLPLPLLQAFVARERDHLQATASTRP